MIKEFSDNVQKLFDESVLNRSVQFHHTAADLLAILHHKVTQPTQVTTDGFFTRVIYYNVSIVLKNDLSSMNIAYNSDYQMTFHHLASCDIHQLSEFILTLERDIPKWRHIWTAADRLHKEKSKIGERLKSSMQKFQSDWMSTRAEDDEKMLERFRIKYYNLQACKMCLDIDNPFWENKNTEAEILEECHTLHMNPPIEQWFIDFSDFVDECKQMRDERDRQREEQKRSEEKARHLSRIKQLKFETIINSIELHNDFKVTIEQHILNRRIGFFVRLPRHNPFLIRFHINSVSTSFHVNINDIDRCTPAIVNAIKRINDMIPELHNALIDDGQQYFLMDDGVYMGQTIDDASEPFCVVKYSYEKKQVIPCRDLASSRVVSRINAVIRKLYSTLFHNDGQTDKEDILSKF